MPTPEQRKDAIKQKFQTGMKPKQADFAEWIDETELQGSAQIVHDLLDPKIKQNKTAIESVGSSAQAIAKIASDNSTAITRKLDKSTALQTTVSLDELDKLVGIKSDGTEVVFDPSNLVEQEVGTWSSYFSYGSTSVPVPGLNFQILENYYVKIGKLVLCHAHVKVTGTALENKPVIINPSNLPYLPQDLNNDYSNGLGRATIGNTKVANIRMYTDKRMYLMWEGTYQQITSADLEDRASYSLNFRYLTNE